MHDSELQFLTKLGSGGFGRVYEATLPNLRGTVAVKLLKVEDEEARKRLVREIKLLSTLHHRNIIPILEYKLEDGQVWFAMPLADQSLLDKMQSEKIPEQKIQDYFLQILDGIEYAHNHEQRIIHRDLKPENVLLFGEDALVADFGLGKPLERHGLYSTLTQHTEQIGSAGYTAPEQWKDVRNSQEAADIYSLGMLLYVMLAREVPYPTYEPSLIPRKYLYIIQRCARKEPTHRYASVNELRQAFLTAIDRTSFQIASPDEEQLAKLFALPCRPELANDILRILYDNGENRRLYKACVPEMSRNYVDYFIQNGMLGDIKHILAQFDEYITGSLNFRYCDVVAEFYEMVAEVCTDIDVFKLLLERLLVMGVAHNRWHVMDVFCNLVCSLTERDPSRTMTAVEVLEIHPEDFRMLYSHKETILSDCSLPRLLRTTMGRIVAGSEYP